MGEPGNHSRGTTMSAIRYRAAQGGLYAGRFPGERASSAPARFRTAWRGPFVRRRRRYGSTLSKSFPRMRRGSALGSFRFAARRSIKLKAIATYARRATDAPPCACFHQHRRKRRECCSNTAGRRLRCSRSTVWSTSGSRPSTRCIWFGRRDKIAWDRARDGVQCPIAGHNLGLGRRRSRIWSRRAQVSLFHTDGHVQIFYLKDAQVLDMNYGRHGSNAACLWWMLRHRRSCFTRDVPGARANRGHQRCARSGRPGRIFYGAAGNLDRHLDCGR